MRQFDALDVMQADLADNYPQLEIQILGLNEWSQAIGNDEAADGRLIPWLQDQDDNSNGASDVLENWGLIYRDVAILDANNELVDTYNLTQYDLGDPRTDGPTENYETLRQLLIDAAEEQNQATSWTNPVESLDVNDDGLISPIDALIVINELNTVGPRQLDPPGAGEAPPPFVDTSGDGYASPIDALLILDHLTVQPSSSAAAVSAVASDLPRDDVGSLPEGTAVGTTTPSAQMVAAVAAALAANDWTADSLFDDPAWEA